MDNPFNIQRGDKIKLTNDYKIPDPVNPNDTYPLKAGQPYEFVQFTDDQKAEIIYLTDPIKLNTFVPPDLILPYIG